MSCRRIQWLLGATIGVSLAISSCGGTAPQSQAPVHAASPQHHAQTSEVAVSAEVGGLNEEATGRVFQRAEPGFESCFKRRAKTIELLSGTVRFFVVVGTDERAKSVAVEESSLGDRDAENCMRGVLMGLKWPKPVGGRTAHAHYTAAPFELLDPDVREPVDVDPSQVSKVRRKLEKQAGDCHVTRASNIQVTAYLDTYGKVITAGAATPDSDGEGPIDCLLGLIKTAEFPSPGSYAGKVTFVL